MQIENRAHAHQTQKFVQGELVMARVIDFYTPKNFRREVTAVPQSQLGKVIEISLRAKKSA